MTIHRRETTTTVAGLDLEDRIGGPLPPADGLGAWKLKAADGGILHWERFLLLNSSEAKWRPACWPLEEMTEHLAKGCIVALLTGHLMTDDGDDDDDIARECPRTASFLKRLLDLRRPLTQWEKAAVVAIWESFHGRFLPWE